MSQTTGELQAHIRDTREDLNENLKELGQKVRSATDWRQHYEKSPGVFLAVALGAGMLLARSGRNDYELSERSARPSEVRGSLEAIKSALIGVAATHVKEWLGALLPVEEGQGLEQHKPNRQQTAARPAQARAPKSGQVHEDTRDAEPDDNGASRA